MVETGMVMGLWLTVMFSFRDRNGSEVVYLLFAGERGVMES